MLTNQLNIWIPNSMDIDFIRFMKFVSEEIKHEQSQRRPDVAKLRALTHFKQAINVAATRRHEYRQNMVDQMLNGGGNDAA